MYSKVTQLYTYGHLFKLYIHLHYGLLQNIGYSSLCYTVGSCRWSILYTLVSVLSWFSRAWLFETSLSKACQTSLSMGFPRQEYWSGLPFPSPGDLQTRGWNPHLLRLLHAGRFFTAELLKKPMFTSLHLLIPTFLCWSSPAPSPPSWQPQVSSLCLWVCVYFTYSFICVVF